MKFTPVLLLAFLAVQSAVAHPQPLFLDLFSDLAQKFGDATGRIIEGSADIVNRGVDTANGIVRGGIETGTGIARGVVGGITGAVVNGANTLNGISKSIQNGIADTINSFTSTFVRNAASSFQSQIQALQDRAEGVLVVSQEKLNGVKDAIEAEAQKAIDGINDFVIEQEDRIAGTSDETQEKAIQLLDQFINESNDKIKQCARGILAPVQALNDKSVDTIQNSFPLIDEVVEKIRQCAQLNQRDSRATSACAREIKSKADGLKPLVNQYADLVRQLNRVNPSAVLNSPCVASVRNELRNSKQSLAARIDQLIEENN